MFLDQLRTKNYTNGARIGAIHLSQLEVWVLEHLSQKDLDDIYHRLEGMHFLRNNITKFPTLRHLPSRYYILTTVTPNFVRLEPMETRHPELSRDIKFEEIKARKGLQTKVRKLDQKLRKIKNSQKFRVQVGGCVMVSCNTIA